MRRLFALNKAYMDSGGIGVLMSGIVSEVDTFRVHLVR